MIDATSVDRIAFPLFVPADRPERLEKAVAARPDAVIIDLEDSVAPDAKVMARTELKSVLAVLSSDIPLILRVNAHGTDWLEDDLAAAASMNLAAVMLPKAETASDIWHAEEAADCPVIALIESALGIARIDEVAGAAHRIAFGSIDYAADLAIRHTPRALSHARAQIVIASRLAGLASPIDGVTTSVHNAERLTEDCAISLEMGFGGKLLIHPAQIAPTRAAFLPSDAEFDWARRVLEAASGKGAFVLDGAMVDAPVLAHARNILARLSARV